MMCLECKHLEVVFWDRIDLVQEGRREKGGGKKGEGIDWKDPVQRLPSGNPADPGKIRQDWFLCYNPTALSHVFTLGSQIEECDWAGHVITSLYWFASGYWHQVLDTLLLHFFITELPTKTLIIALDHFDFPSVLRDWRGPAKCDMPGACTSLSRGTNLLCGVKSHRHVLQLINWMTTNLSSLFQHYCFPGFSHPPCQHMFPLSVSLSFC